MEGEEMTKFERAFRNSDRLSQTHWTDWGPRIGRKMNARQSRRQKMWDGVMNKQMGDLKKIFRGVDQDVL